MIENMNWIELKSQAQLDLIHEESKTQPVLIFKHSTRCSISSTALSRLNRNWKSEEAPIKTYYVDLISNRSISDQLAAYFDVEHQSPQVLVIQNGRAILVQSHLAINFDEIRKAVSTN